MALLYTISEKGNPADQSVPKKYYLQSKIRGSKSLPEKRDRPEGTNLTDWPVRRCLFLQAIPWATRLHKS